MDQSESPAILASIDFNPDEGGRTVAAARRLAPGESPDLRAAVSRYLDVLGRTVDLEDAAIVFASPERSLNATMSSRTVYARDIHPQVGDVAGRIGVGRDVLAMVVLEHDLIAKIPEMGDEALRELVCSDFGAVVAGMVSMKGTGLVAEYLPWLVSLAGSVLAYGTGGDGGGVADRAVTKTFHAFSNRGGSQLNPFSKLHLRHPDLLPVLQAVARNASAAVAGKAFEVPAPHPVICEVARRVVIDSLRPFGVGIERSRQTA